MTQRPTVLILGASGNVGRAAAERFLADERFDVVTMARREPTLPASSRHRYVAVDLRDGDAVTRAVAVAGAVTHVVYAALFEKPDLIAGWVDPEQIMTNRAMLANLLNALDAAGAPIEHVSILQGTKAYGYHVQPMRIPAKESQPRVEHENFYWEQEDLLRAAAADRGFAFTIWRPQFIFGGVLGAAMNLIPVIGVYAAVCRELGRPFSFTGGDSYVAEAVDSRLLAEALLWAATDHRAWRETFNITNGDVFEWRDLWPALGEMLDVELGPDEPLSLAQWLPRQEAAWQALSARAGLPSRSIPEIVGYSHAYADDAFAYTSDGSPLPARSRPVLLSTVKLRQAGFTECIDTEAMFDYWFRRLRHERVLP